MKTTEKLGLHQWESTDPIRMSAFNENFSLLENAVSSAAQIAAGTYTGNGKSGKNAPNTLTFDFPPKLLLVFGPRGEVYERVTVLRPMDRAYVYLSFLGSDYDEPLYFTWSDKGVSWYSTDYVYQLNRSGTQYYYLAIG